jgi:Queuosine biosynthesis protein QueC
MNRYKNWMTFTFDDHYDRKVKVDSHLKINFKIPGDTQFLPYFEALKNNARVMRDSFAEPFDVLFSGGTDSEAAVRTFKDLGIKHNTFIFRYENDLNIRCIQSAEEICKSLNIPYKIIDFNLKKFYETEAFDLFDKTLCPAVSSLSRLKWLDYLDNIPVNCGGEPHWIRTLDGDYSVKSDWRYYIEEMFSFFALNSKVLNRVMIDEWFTFTPQPMMSFHKEPLIKKLINDEFTGKQGTISSRIPVYQTYWPETKMRPKLTGYEGPTGTAWVDLPPYFKDFYKNNKKMIGVTNTKISYSLQEFESIFQNCPGFTLSEY